MAGLLRPVTSEELLQSGVQIRIADFALPNHQDCPAHLPQRFLVHSITLNVAFQFRTPIVQAGFRNMRVDALSMLMPEAATDLDDLVQPGKNQIGFAWKVAHMESISEPHAMYQTAHQHFRRSVG